MILAEKMRQTNVGAILFPTFFCGRIPPGGYFPIRLYYFSVLTGMSRITLSEKEIFI